MCCDSFTFARIVRILLLKYLSTDSPQAHLAPCICDMTHACRDSCIGPWMIRVCTAQTYFCTHTHIHLSVYMYRYLDCSSVHCPNIFLHKYMYTHIFTLPPCQNEGSTHTSRLEFFFTHLHLCVYMYRYLDYSSVYCLSTFLPTRRTRIWRQLITMSLGRMNRGQRPLCGLLRTPCASICICTWIYTHLYVYVYVYMYMYMYMCSCVCICMYMYMYMCMCICICVYVYTYTSTCTCRCVLCAYCSMSMHPCTLRGVSKTLCTSMCTCIYIHVYIYNVHCTCTYILCGCTNLAKETRILRSLLIVATPYIYNVHSRCTCLLSGYAYGVATISRLLKISGLFCQICKRAL